MGPITEFYGGRTVFVTGATGFMGKVLLEKMVRCLPGLEKIYILIRPKKGLTPEERVREITRGQIFQFNDLCEKAFDKIEAISGDISKENFGISEVDRRKLIDEVSVVFNLAASIRMDLSLKEAIITNTKSAYELFKFCTKMKNLVSVVHLSTAYCNVEINDMEEKVYPLDTSPYKIMDLVEWMNEEHLASIENNLIRPHPNTYTFTKRLAEMVAVDMGQKIPVVIVRPSIVLPAIREPCPGWVDSLNGPVGLGLATARGILRTVFVDPDCRPQTIPVDCAINSLLIFGYQRATDSFTETPIFNATQGNLYWMTWGEAIGDLMDLAYKYPPKIMVWYPLANFTTSYYLYMFYAMIFHFLPALVVDLLLIMFLQKPFLYSIQRRIFTASKVLSSFTVKDWSFSNTECMKIWENMDPEDSQVFYSHVGVSVKQYFNNVYHFTRIFFFKQSDECLTPHFLLKTLYVLDRSVKLLFCYFSLTWGFRFFQMYILPAACQPYPGWVDSFNGPVGLCLAAGRGILRTVLVDPDCRPQSIPVDCAINGLIIFGHHRATNSFTETPVFNVTQGNFYPITWGEAMTQLMDLTYKYPPKMMLWYPLVSFTTSFCLNTFYTIIFHFLPALLVDFLLIMFLQKPFLYSVQRRIFAASKVLSRFTVKDWTFSNTECIKIWENLDPEDSKVFYSHLGICVKQYFDDVHRFGRNFIFKQDDESLTSRFLLKTLYLLDRSVKLLFGYISLTWGFRLVYNVQ